MHQHEFIKSIENLLNENSFSQRIAIYKGKMNSAMSEIPASFIQTLPEILKLMSRSLDLLCQDKNKGILIVGIRPCVSMIEENDRSHFCCSLEFEIHPLKELHQIDKRTHTFSVIINFSTGEIMNNDMYVNKLFIEYLKNAVIYGNIDSQTLSQCWKQANWNTANVYQSPVSNHGSCGSSDVQKVNTSSLPLFDVVQLASHRHAKNQEISYSPLDEYTSHNDDLHYNISNF
jgi:hypothetical protein